MRSILAGLTSHGSSGSVSSKYSFALETPSASQSRFEVTVTVILSTIKSQLNSGLLLSVNSSPFVTPSPSQSRLFHTVVGDTVCKSKSK